MTRTLLALAAAACLAHPANAADPDLIAKLLPAVVNISIISFTTAGAETGNVIAERTTSEKLTKGSGFVVDPSGLIATNRHVVAGAHSLTVVLQDGTRLQATLLGAATQMDMALIKVNPDHPLPSLEFGDSDAMHIGNPVTLIGNPLGLPSTVTAGIIGALDRDTTESEAVSFIQFDAALNTGNSGGPVFNDRGQVIGVATALFAPGSETGSVGLGFAIPSNDAVYILRQLRAIGEVKLGWIGVHVAAVTQDVATTLGLDAPRGSILTGVEALSPAAKAGLAPGDVILELASGAEATPRLLNRAIASAELGSDLKLTVWRNREKQQVTVPVGESAADNAPKVKGPRPVAAVDRPDLGMLLAPIDADIRDRLGATPVPGVMVSNVIPGSPAADHGILAGSLLQNVQHNPVASPADVQQQLDEARRQQARAVLLLVVDAQGRRWVSIPLRR